MNTSSFKIAFGLCSIFSQLLLGQQQDDPQVWLKPPALRPGDTIAIVAPSGPVNIDQVQAYSRILQEAGYSVLIPESITRSERYLAGTDEQRADELNSMIRNPKVRAIFPARGGYGLTRILDRLDYDALLSDSKIIIGFSDVTALHLAVSRKCQLVTFHSPLPMAHLWKGDIPEFTFANSHFRRAIFAGEYTPHEVGYIIAAPQERPAETLVGGIAQGRLMGGNLSLISSTLGTPYEIDAHQAILFLEDVGEAPYRIDRMLSQLRLRGVLNQVNGVVLGDFSQSDGTMHLEMRHVLRDYFGAARVPVVWNFPVGHVATNVTLPVGAMVELDADQCSVRLLENPIVLDRAESD